MILYILKSLVLSALFYGLYYSLLREQKSFRWNRFYLILSSLCAVLLPLICIRSFSFKKVQEIAASNPYQQTLKTITIYGEQVSSHELNYAKLITAILFIGLLWGLLRIVLGFIVLKRSKLNAEVETYFESTVYFNQSIETPFSFQKQIFIPASLKESSILPTVLEHELAHCRLNHTLDKIYFSALQALCWFNPFVYLAHRELELVHEYEADAYVTQHVETDYYVETLLQTLTYNQTAPTILVHSFFTHPLKTRITMLYKKSKQTLMQKSTVFIVALLICVVALFIQSSAQKKNYSYKILSHPYDTVDVELPNGTIEKRIVQILPDTVYEQADKMPEFEGGEQALFNYISKNITYPTSDKIEKREGKVIVQFAIRSTGEIFDVNVIPNKNNSFAMEQESISVVKNMPKWRPGTIKGKSVSIRYLLPIRFSLK